MNLTDQWIVGFADGDGSFKIYPTRTKRKDGTVTIGKRFCFTISQDVRSISVLYAIKKHFGCGSVHKAGGTMYEFRVTNKDQMGNIILPFFLKNPLQTVKFDDFRILYEDLFQVQIANPFPKPPVNRDWLTGFIDAEANFHVSMTNNYPRPHFVIGLHLRDRAILNDIQIFMSCGIVYTKHPAKKNPYIVYQISTLGGWLKMISICVTNMNRCLLKTIKRVDFLKFKRIIYLIQQGKHLTPKGICEINKIKNTKV